MPPTVSGSSGAPGAVTSPGGRSRRLDITSSATTVPSLGSSSGGSSSTRFVPRSTASTFGRASLCRSVSTGKRPAVPPSQRLASPIGSVRSPTVRSRGGRSRFSSPGANKSSRTCFA
eukprot:6657001-Prymnesium_polylepis.1